MGRIKAWLKKYWWLLILGLVTAVVTLWLIFRSRKKAVPAVKFSTKAREKVVEAQTEAKIAKLKVKAEADVKRRELEVIEKVDSGVERRKMLAEFLDDNL